MRRRERPPAAALAQLPPDERVLSWADTAEGAVVLASTRGLWWPGPEGLRLIPWQLVDKVVWGEAGLTVTEAEVLEDTLLVDRAPLTARLSIPRDLPPTVRARVDANVVRSEVASVEGGTVRFVARRVPGRDGLTWWARLEDGAHDTSPVRAAVTARLAILRARSDAERS